MHTSQRVSEHRRRLYAAGLRPLQIWVPDVRWPGFAEECRRQSLRLWADPAEREAIRAAEDLGDWTDR